MLEFMIIIVSQWQMQEAIALLEKANKHKSDFLCRMSHELRYVVTLPYMAILEANTLRRTPLSGIIGAADIMAFAPLADEYKKLVEITQACSKNLLQVINDILDFSKVRIRFCTSI
jgi:signal transduction histidine kinase